MIYGLSKVIEAGTGLLICTEVVMAMIATLLLCLPGFIYIGIRRVIVRCRFTH